MQARLSINLLCCRDPVSTLNKTSIEQCKLGLDTGGTFTDAVLLDTSGHIAAHAKSPTTHHDLSIGLRGAVTGLGAALNDYQISLVSLSTTLATNALVEGHGRRVCLILVGYSRQQLERARLSEVMGSDPVVFIAGGHTCLLYTSPSPRDRTRSRMPSSA